MSLMELRGTPSSNLIFDIVGGKSGYKLFYDQQPETFNKPTTYNRSTLLLTGANIPHISDFNFWTLNANATYIPKSFLGGNHQFKVGYYLGRRDNAGGRPKNPAGDYALLFDTVVSIASLQGCSWLEASGAIVAVMLFGQLHHLSALYVPAILFDMAPALHSATMAWTASRRSAEDGQQ